MTTAKATELAEVARRDLAKHLGIAAGEVRVTAVRPQRWPDASMGCPKPGKVYAQVVVEGFIIVLEAGGHTYEYRSDGRRVKACERD